MPVLVVDIGNTSTSVALYRNGRVTRTCRLDTAKTTPQSVKRMARTVAGEKVVTGAMLASVVPAVNRIWTQALSTVVAGPIAFVHHRLNLGVSLRYPQPGTIGADRLANAVAGVHRYGAPLIVADFGTAVTFDVITQRGYEGGVIAPGMPLVFDYLAERTALLPHLRMHGVRGPWGRSTRQAMLLGAHWGYPGLVRGILHELKSHPDLRRARVVVTGGHADRIGRALGKSAVVDSTLTLYGVGRIYELNFGSQA